MQFLDPHLKGHATVITTVYISSRLAGPQIVQAEWSSEFEKVRQLHAYSNHNDRPATHEHAFMLVGIWWISLFPWSIRNLMSCK